MTSSGAGVFVNDYGSMTADMGAAKAEEWTVSGSGRRLDMYVWATDRMADAVKGVHRLQGGSIVPPDWSTGPIVCRYSPDLTVLDGYTSRKYVSVRIPSGNHETPVLSVSGGVTADKLTKLKIENFDNFEGSVDLIACGVNCRDELLKLVANLQGDYKGRRLRVVKGTRLVFSSPVGFCLTIR